MSASENKRGNSIREVLSILRSAGFSSPIRLAIMLYLTGSGHAYFNDLVEALDVTPGNLWSHLEKLEEQGMIRIRRVLRDRPRVRVEVTDKGVEETLRLIRKLKEVIQGCFDKSA